MSSRLIFCFAVVLPLAVIAQSNAPPDHATIAPVTNPATSMPSVPTSAATNVTPMHRRNASGLDAGPPESKPAVSAGLRVSIDPQTHELRDTPETQETLEQAERLRDVNAQLPRPDYSKMQIENRPNGSVVLHNNGQIMMSSSVRMKADGSYEETCVLSAAARPGEGNTEKQIGADKEKSP